MKKKFTTRSAKETAELGERLGSLINEKCVIAFMGDLGSGKTCFTSGLCKGLNYEGDVNSPTFALVNEYLGGRMPVYHFDMYRIGSEEELYSIGFFDYLEEQAVIVVEWSENIEYSLPEDSIYVTFSNQNGNHRDITVHCAFNKNFLKEL